MAATTRDRSASSTYGDRQPRHQFRFLHGLLRRCPGASAGASPSCARPPSLGERILSAAAWTPVGRGLGLDLSGPQTPLEIEIITINVPDARRIPRRAAFCTPLAKMVRRSHHF